MSLTPDPHIGNKSHFSGLDALDAASSADDVALARTNPEKWLFTEGSGAKGGI